MHPQERQQFLQDFFTESNGSGSRQISDKRSQQQALVNYFRPLFRKRGREKKTADDLLFEQTLGKPYYELQQEALVQFLQQKPSRRPE